MSVRRPSKTSNKRFMEVSKRKRIEAVNLNPKAERKRGLVFAFQFGPLAATAFNANMSNRLALAFESDFGRAMRRLGCCHWTVAIRFQICRGHWFERRWSG